MNCVIKNIFSPRVFIWVYPLLLIVPNIALAFTEHYSPLTDCVNILLPWGIYTLVLNIWRNVGRTALLMFPIAFYAAFQIVLLYLYGGSIIAVDMFINVVTTNVSEATELLGNLTFAVITVIVLYVPALVWGAVMAVKRHILSTAQRRPALIAGAAGTTAGLLLLGLCCIMYKPFAIDRNLFPVNVMSNTLTAAKRTARTEEYNESSSSFRYDTQCTHDKSDKEIYILVIGETSRASNWQLAGYDRPTNPRLTKRVGHGAYFFPYVLSESNTTHKSVPLMLSWCTAENFGDSIYTSKGLISAFNEAGYTTAYASNQGRNHSFIDFFAQEAQKSIFLTDDGKSHYDGELLADVSEFLNAAGSGKYFLVLHTYGSHFNYVDRYPQQCRFFEPDQAGDANVYNRDKLLNSYDNTIRYTDMVLDSIISLTEAQNCTAAILYTSDHGEDIFDDERHRFLHASPTPTYHQLHVPLLIWLSPEYAAKYQTEARNCADHTQCEVSSSRVVFDTMLDLAGLKTTKSCRRKSLASDQYATAPRRYVNDYNEGVPLSASGMVDEDFEEISRHGMSWQ